MVVWLPSAASHLSTAAFHLPWSSQSCFLRDFHHLLSGATLNPFCVSKYLSLPVTQSQKSEKGPINLADHYLSLLIVEEVMENKP